MHNEVSGRKKSCIQSFTKCKEMHCSYSFGNKDPFFLQRIFGIVWKKSFLLDIVFKKVFFTRRVFFVTIKGGDFIFIRTWILRMKLSHHRQYKITKLERTCHNNIVSHLNTYIICLYLILFHYLSWNLLYFMCKLQIKQTENV